MAGQHVPGCRLRRTFSCLQLFVCPAGRLVSALRARSGDPRLSSALRRRGRDHRTVPPGRGRHVGDVARRPVGARADRRLPGGRAGCGLRDRPTRHPGRSRHRRSGDVLRPGLSHCAMAARCRSGREAGRRHRHRGQRRTGDPGHRRGGRTPHRLPALRSVCVPETGRFVRSRHPRGVPALSAAQERRPTTDVALPRVLRHVLLALAPDAHLFGTDPPDHVAAHGA